MSKLHGVLFSLDDQKTLIERHCFGDCGKISMGGAIIDDRLGILMVCCEIKCPYEKGCTDHPIGESEMTGEDIYIRALEEKQPPEAASDE